MFYWISFLQMNLCFDKDFLNLLTDVCVFFFFFFFLQALDIMQIRIWGWSIVWTVKSDLFHKAQLLQGKNSYDEKIIN